MPLNKQKLTKRAWTALASIFMLFLFIVFLPSWCMHILLIVLCGVGIHEFENIANGLGYKLYPLVVFLSVALGIATLYTEAIDLTWIPYLVVAVCGLVSLIPPNDMKKTLPQVGITLLASCYLSLALVSIAYLFSAPTVMNPLIGRALVGFCLLLVWAGDTTAYFVGSILGSHKIAPKASPKKTYEGVFGNLLGNYAMGWLAKLWAGAYIPEFARLTHLDIIFLALVFGVLGFFGDIMESTWKRGADIKDSGSLFPGHGGLLDRIDSIFLTAPVLYFYMIHVVFANG